MNLHIFNMRRTSVQIKEPNVCDECGCSVLIRDNSNGELVCSSCGVVVSEITNISLYPSSDVLPFSKPISPVSPVLVNWGLPTKIDWSLNIKRLSGADRETRTRIFRLRKWNHRIRISGYKGNTLERGLNLLKTVSSQLNLPLNVLETSCVFFRKIVKKGLTRGKHTMDLVSAVIYMACRQCMVLRTVSEISDACGVSRSSLARNYRKLYEILELDIPSYPKSSYISRLASKLGLLGPIERISLELLHLVNEKNLLQGCSPKSIAAACVYVSSKTCGVSLTQELVSREANITEITLRNRYKQLLGEIEVEISV